MIVFAKHSVFSTVFHPNRIVGHLIKFRTMHITQNLIRQIKDIIVQSRERAIRSVDFERVLMYWQIGKVIFEEEQQGEDRAAYGTFLIRSLAETLQPQFGSGFSIRQLEMCRQFYRMFPIANALRAQFSW